MSHPQPKPGVMSLSMKKKKRSRNAPTVPIHIDSSDSDSDSDRASKKQHVGGHRLDSTLDISLPKPVQLIVNYTEPIPQEKDIVEVSHSGQSEKDISDAEIYRRDIKDRPEALDVTSSKYDTMPVEQFGVACLMGANWRPGKPIGRSNKAVVGIYEVQKRPSLRGLGAKVAKPPPALNKNRPKQPITKKRHL